MLYKCLKDLYTDRLVPLLWDDIPSEPFHVFGQEVTNTFISSSSAKFKYWEDPAFLQNVKRSFETLTFDAAEQEIERLHSIGLDAFIKATATKRLVAKVPIGKKLIDVLGSDCYEFCDIPHPCLMVQQFVDFEHEMRFFFVDNSLITQAHCIPHITPLDRPNHKDAFQFYFSRYMISLIPMVKEIQRIAKELQYQDAIIDVGLSKIRTSDYPLWDLIEINPLIPGQIGLYDCDVSALAESIHSSKLEERIHLYR